MKHDSTQETADVEVRALTEADLEDVIRIDAKSSGGPRRDYFRLKLKDALERSSVRISLAAVADGRVVGFVIASVFYGDFGRVETSATLEAVAVEPNMKGRGVGRALWRQLAVNLKGMRVERVDTLVTWDNLELLGFFQQLGFEPSRRLSLERRLDPEKDEA
jgi:ribosomal protein S18 acetylase RimI-like enzyme